MRRSLRVTALTLALALLFSVCPVTNILWPVAASTADRTIGRLPVPPTVDGVLSQEEWGGMDMPLVNYQTFTIPGEAAKTELEGEVYLGWDDTHMYLAIAARYEEHANGYNGFDVWRGDALQIQIAANGGKRYAFAFAAGDDGVVRGYCSGKETYEVTATGGEFFVRRDEAINTTFYEIALPLSRFSGEDVLQEGDRLRFSYAVHMHNGYYYEWCGGIVREKNIDKAAEITLGAEKPMSAEVTETLKMGDVDKSGRVDSTDARLMLQYAVGKIGEDDLDLRVADVDGNQKMDSTDARLVLQFAVEKITELPVGNTLTVTVGTGTLNTDTRAVSSNTFAPSDVKAGKAFLALSELEKKEAEKGAAEFAYFAFTKYDNPHLPFAFACYDGGDTLTAMVPAGIDLSAMIPVFSYYGDDVLMDGRPVVSQVTVLDLTQDVVLTLTPWEGESRTVTVHVEALDTGLPSVALTTENMQEIVKKEEYVNTTFYLGGGEMEVPMLVTSRAKGRGNSTWGHPKKSYTLKLDKKATLLGMSESKDWALVSNYEDKSLLRNIAAVYLAKGTGQAWVPDRRPVDLWYNGCYWGTYDLAEKVEVESDRVDIVEYMQGMATGQSGFLLEFDGHVGEVSDEQRAQWVRPLGDSYDIFYDPATDELFMQVPHSHKWLTLKDPDYKDLEHYTLQILYIHQQVTRAVKALESGDYNRIADCFDIPSFCQWYLVEEFMNNTDSAFHSSCYMTLDAGGKFTMGPIWDFDRSSENCHYWNPEEKIDELYNQRSAWFYMLFAVPECREILKQEYEVFRKRLVTLPAYVESVADTLYASQEYNFIRWPILTTVVNGPNEWDEWNAVAQAQRDSQTFESEVARLNAYFARRTAQMEAFMKTQ